MLCVSAEGGREGGRLAGRQAGRQAVATSHDTQEVGMYEPLLASLLNANGCGVVRCVGGRESM